MQLMFSGFGGGATTAAATPAPDQVDPSPRVFRAKLPFEKLPAYDPGAPFAGAVDATAGPFGLRVKSLALTEDPAAGIEIEIEAVGTGISNLGDDQEGAFLEITHVVGANGEDLLREESCGLDRNDRPEPLSDLGGVLTASKRVRVEPDVAISDVASLAGHVRLALPVRTESVRVSPIEPGARIERAGAVLEITEAGERSFGYRVSGRSRRLLHLRALDGEKRPLQRRGGSSMGAFFGDGRSGSLEFAGKIAHVDAIFAIEEKVRKFPFELASVLPGTAGEMVEDAAPSFVAYSHARLEREFARALKAVVKRESEPVASAHTGPFAVELQDLQSFFGLRSRIVVRTPDIPNVEHSLNALELELQQIRLRDGTVQRGSPDPVSAPWHTRLAIGSAWGEEGLSGQAWLDTGMKAEVEAVESLDGVVRLRHPTGVRTLALEPAQLGQSADGGDGLHVTLSRVGRDTFTLSGPAGGHRVLGVTAFNSEGKRLAIQSAQVNETDRGWSAVLQVSGIPHRLNVIVATGIERVDYGFVLRLDKEV
jgi:hypothetical protein